MIFGDGAQTRDFVYIGDIVEGWVTALGNDKAAGGIFNLGSGRSTSINDLAAYAAGAFGHKPGAYDIRYAPARPGEQRRVQADISQARAVLGWEPRTRLEDGLAETVRQGRAGQDGNGQAGTGQGRAGQSGNGTSS
jgi:UDP-glucose 4-epimerase